MDDVPIILIQPDQSYRDDFIALADERFGTAEVRRSEQYLELYGIFPTFRVIRERLAEEERHSCHDGVNDSTLESLSDVLRPVGRQGKRQRRTLRHARSIKRQLEQAREKRGVATIQELASDPRLAAKLAQRFNQFLQRDPLIGEESPCRLTRRSGLADIGRTLGPVRVAARRIHMCFHRLDITRLQTLLQRDLYPIQAPIPTPKICVDTNAPRGE